MISKTFYACGVDWQHEIGEAPDFEGKVPLYTTEEELKANQPCWTQCGIVKLRLSLVEWTLTQDLWGQEKRDIRS